jgi:serine/threonine protein kinase/capsular polysaccharide biosynthesis protein
MKSGLATGTEPQVPGGKGPGFVPPPVGELAKLFPQLELIELVGQGGMGAVYKARQPGLDRFVALKILPPIAAGDPGFAERFNREARALARLNHPNIVNVHDFGRAGSLHYLIMEFVDGGNLRQVEAAGRLTPEQALAIVPQICEALQFAHNEGIVHRDIKPENILLDKKGRVKITDFGIAKMLGLSGGSPPLTGVRDVVGTPHYMAPEQLEKPQTVDHRADIYSLGVVFYEMLTGQLPLGKFAPPSRKVHVDVRLDEVVLRALEQEPEMRYQQASQVKTAVETITQSGDGRADSGTSGSSGHGPRVNAEALAEELLARDYVPDINSCLRRAWALVRSDFWPLVGITALVLLVFSAVSSAGTVISNASGTEAKTSVIGLLLSGPLLGGLRFLFLKKIRGEPVTVQTAFAGFGNIFFFFQLMLAGLVMTVLTGLGVICLILPGIYLVVVWRFALPLIMDKGLEFWPAMRVSRIVVSKHWWQFFCFFVVLGLINLAGLLVLCVGVFVTVAVTLTALMYAYEDIFNPTRSANCPASATPAQGLDGTRSATPQSSAPVAPPRTKSKRPPVFLASFVAVFLLVFGASAVLTFILPESFMSMARLRVLAAAPKSLSPGASGTYDPYLIETECQIIQSQAILEPAIIALGLNEKWGKKFAGGQALNTSESLGLLQTRLEVRPVRNASIIDIRVFSDERDEAAAIANKIAEIEQERVASAGSGGLIEIIERASPAWRPVRPNKPLNLFLGAVAGLLLGVIAGAVCAAWADTRSRKTG